MHFRLTLLIVAALTASIAGAAPSQARVWYWCDASHAYYPWVRSCTSGWRTVNAAAFPRSLQTPSSEQPSQTLSTSPNGFDDTLNLGCAGLGITTPHDPSCERPAPQTLEVRQSGANTPDEKAAGAEAYGNCLMQRPSSFGPGSAFRFDSPVWTKYRQDWRAKCDEAERAAVINFRTQAQAQTQAQAEANRAAFEHDRAINKARTRGYELVASVKDLILDGRELANRNAQIQITGVYKKIGENAAVLYNSQMDAYADNDNNFPVLTDDAQRALREYLMNYSCSTQVGCVVEVGGHVTMCKHLNSLMSDYPPVPCLNIEVQIVYRPGD